MLQRLPCSDTPFRLNRGAWHKPLVSVIVTHHDYSDFVADALASLLDQTHTNWECVVVDDASSTEHRARLEQIIHSIADERINLLALSKNVDQIPAFFAGLERTRGEFVCLLDPDDRYAESFLEESLATHLNETVFCPVASTDQYLLGEQGLISAVNTQQRMRSMQRVGKAYRLDDRPPNILFIPRAVAGWHWASTSSLMFRRAALAHLKPHRALTFWKGADAYLAIGAHALGGTLFLPKPLVYRSIHQNNSSLKPDIYATVQDKKRQASPRMHLIRRDVAEVLAHNGESDASVLVSKQLDDKGPLAKWRRSIMKRLPFGKSVAGK